TCDGPCNVISGNQGDGVNLEDTGTMSNTVQGNYIGLDPSGATTISNTLTGVAVIVGSSNNTIGGERSSAACDGPCNVIGGNGGNGISISETTTANNAVQGNYLGLSADGALAVPNSAASMTPTYPAVSI